MHTTRAQRQRLKTENRKWPSVLIEIASESWLPNLCGDDNRVRVWRSRDYLVQEFESVHGRRLSVNRTTMRPDGRWDDDLSWDELQAIKRQVGYCNAWLVEFYPPDRDVVNAANMRHLWVLPEKPVLGWHHR